MLFETEDWRNTLYHPTGCLIKYNPEGHAGVGRIKAAGGGSRDITVDTRIISATNQNLFQKVLDGQFRSDLIYRLNMFTIQLPPLRKRISGVPMLARHMLEEAKPRIGKNIVDLDNKTIEQMKQYNWPGNVRELHNIVERACILAKSEAARQLGISRITSREKLKRPEMMEKP